MIPLVQLKQNLDFNRNLSGVIEVLKTATSIQLQQFQTAERGSESYSRNLQICIQMLNVKESQHPLLCDHPGRPSCIVLVTSDEGFLGELNGLLISAALEVKKTSQTPHEDEMVVLGERGAVYLEEMNQSHVYFPGVSEDLDPKEVIELRNYLMKAYLAGRFGKITVIYPKLISLTFQQVQTQELLPLRQLFNAEQFDSYCLTGPSLDSLIEGLVRLWLDGTLYHIFGSSKLSELSARLIHLEGSTQELSRIEHQQATQYFRTLHALADKSIREILTSRLLVGRH